MKKILCLVCMLMMVLSMGVPMAAANGAEPTGSVKFSSTVADLSKLPKVAVLYINNAKTTYDADIDQLMLQTFTNCLPADKYVYVDGAPYAERLSKIGIVDLSTAERQDIVDAFLGEDVDYVIYSEIQPLVTKDKVTFFTIGKDITANVYLKIIDLVNCKYLYNGKFTEKASDSSMIGGIGNKSVSIKAITKINEQMGAVLTTRLPGTKPVAVKRSEK